LLKLGFEIAQSSVAKYMLKRSVPLSTGWRAFLRNHALDVAAMDLFVAPTIGFNLRPACPRRSPKPSACGSVAMPYDLERSPSLIRCAGFIKKPEGE
jgi:hypothetical protein